MAVKAQRWGQAHTRDVAARVELESEYNGCERRTGLRGSRRRSHGARAWPRKPSSKSAQAEVAGTQRRLGSEGPWADRTSGDVPPCGSANVTYGIRTEKRSPDRDRRCRCRARVLRRLCRGNGLTASHEKGWLKRARAVLEMRLRRKDDNIASQGGRARGKLGERRERSTA